MATDTDLDAAHRHSLRHRADVERSDRCGCFYCRAIFAPSTIDRWVDDGDTALCPHCEIDSVIGDASGFPIDDAFLRRMHARWFGA